MFITNFCIVFVFVVNYCCDIILCHLQGASKFHWHLQLTWSDDKVRELITVKVLHTSLLKTTVVAFKVLPLRSYAPMPAPSPPLKQFWKWFCGMAFRAAVVLFPMSSLSSKCLPFSISFIFGNRRSHWGLDPVNRQGVPTQLFVL